MANSLYRKWGGLVLPVEASDVTDTLAPLDPARDTALDFFAAAINGELQAAWDKVVTGTTLNGSDPVESKLPWRPTADLVRELKVGFPALSLDREQFTRKRLSILQHGIQTTWGLHYMLKPLDAADSRRLADVLQAVAKILQDAIDENYHPNYQSGAAVFGPGSNTFSEIEITSGQFGKARFAGDDESAPMYWAASMVLETLEIVEPVEDAEGAPFNGVMFELGTGNEQGVIPNLIYADTAIPLQ